jgi:putative transposase
MPRSARIVIPDVPHHVTQRGNNGQDVFFTDDDRRTYLATLRDRCEAADVRVLGYCLMTNHVHLIVVPSHEDGLAEAIGRTHFVHTQYVNRLHGRSGHLWQGRFYSCPLDGRQELA